MLRGARVAVAMSGGVDSTVAAKLLTQQGLRYTMQRRLESIELT